MRSTCSYEDKGPAVKNTSERNSDAIDRQEAGSFENSKFSSDGAAATPRGPTMHVGYDVMDAE